MLRGIYSSASGMLVNQKEQDIRSNNLANINTTGFKKDMSVKGDFREILISRLEREGKDISDLSSGISSIIGHLGTGTILEESVTNFETGSYKETNNPFDLALQGEGFFAVEGPGDEVHYTRNGSFSVDNEGRLVTQQGYPVLSEEGEIVFEDNEEFYIDEEGRIFVDDEEEPSYQLELYNFENPQGLLKVGENLFMETDVSGEAEDIIGDEDLEVLQGYLEESNVSSAEEMAGMINALRAYEANQRALSTQDEALEQAVNRVGRTTG
ncbi:flagellar basal-body rod protein FlgF [Natranaerofaba carboxydovora]|uniref:flagellar basal-body rod protein FlgF n=1 Tax=Natranaerofaba carboxydovora TaxID=2742683 RepID=UPI001F13236B|nr:flagellar basal-body rod protein FlgF [Natranaerofaba carboxydovora]UMZ75093.1 Flagellar basal-body rod protein FlgG [Natranaerofaba carboxydovora]